MRTPKEMANAVVDCWINDSEGNYVQGDPEKAAADLLTAWRDECVAEARKPEAPASEDVEMLAAETARLIADNCIQIDGIDTEVTFEAGRARGIIKDALLSRAPRTESDGYKALLESYEQSRADLRDAVQDARGYRACAEAAYAERDRLKVQNDQLIAQREHWCKPLREENEALRAELQELSIKHAKRGRQLNDLAGICKGRKEEVRRLQKKKGGVS